MRPEPEEVVGDTLVQENQRVGVGLASSLVVDVAEARSEKREDIETPVDPASDHLKLAEGVTPAAPGRGYEVVNSIGEILPCLRRHREGHTVGVTLETDDGESGPKQLFLLVVGETNTVPELQEASLFCGIGRVIRGIVRHVALLLEREGVIYIDKKVLNKLNERRDPHDEGHERNPDTKRGTIPKIVAAINETVAINSDDLFELIKGVERHTTVCERDIRFEKDEANVAVLAAVFEEGSA
jgi:hypothetical protein